MALIKGIKCVCSIIEKWCLKLPKLLKTPKAESATACIER